MCSLDSNFLPFDKVLAQYLDYNRKVAGLYRPAGYLNLLIERLVLDPKLYNVHIIAAILFKFDFNIPTVSAKIYWNSTKEKATHHWVLSQREVGPRRLALKYTSSTLPTF